MEAVRIANSPDDIDSIPSPVEAVNVAPFDVHLVRLGTSPEVVAAADRLYEALGPGTLYDDREASAGVKFADADLIGVPTQVIVGAKGAAAGVAETKDRRTGRRATRSLGE